ncbi:RagB/SusD family nutrient uptake outer membrane protein [Prevotella sp. AGR2160]|uniref:RagB/SusD family nutrient uptake outer membrane protein n=1 Tax=Prevotella sp. AGR2160 TaxID=1280674 RepID=UPI0004007C2F|nr:RagB/SusD family nutrient uptake outer membrane protein [Prevotella sp. AGR2160]
MKKIFLLLSLVLVMTSCLNENDKGMLSEEETYSDKSSLEKNTVAILYNYIGGSSDSQGLQGTKYGVYDFNTFTTDEAIIPIRGGDWYDGGFWQNLYLHAWSANDDELNNTWNYLYKVVTLCNRSLRILKNNRGLLSDSEYAADRSEVRAVRAMFYFYILDMFGNVPLVTEDSVGLDSVKTSPRPKVYRWTVNELQEALPYLPKQRSNQAGYYYGRMTAPVAWFLLAKLAINAEVYDDADWTDSQQPDGKNIFFTVDGQRLNAWQTTIAYAEKLKQMGYSLESDESTDFSTTNETSKENIFTIPMDPQRYTNRFLNLFRSRHYAHGSALGFDAENGSCATVSCVKAYGYGTDDVDSRFALNFYADTVKVDGNTVMLSNGKPLIYQPLEVKVNLTGSEYEKTAGARMAKYEIDRNAYDDGKLQSNDIVLFRYADVLLMRAEALLRNGDVTKSTVYMNLIRERAGMPDLSTASLPNILRERLMELQWEGWRRNDLIRFGRFCSAYDLRTPLTDEEKTHYTIVFPIPEKARELNKRLEQNPGY